jgi:hypothetical protein
MSINKVYLENTFIAGEEFTGPLTGTVTVQKDAFILGNFDPGLNFTNGPWALKVDGTVVSDLAGISFFETDIVAPVRNSTVTVGIEGTVIGTAAGGIYARQGVDITNSGLITGGYGIFLDPFAPSTTKAVSITNNATGIIHGSAAAIEDIDISHALTVKNAGSIEGTVEWAGAFTLINKGEISTRLAALDPNAAFAASITNSGNLSATVSLADGADIVKNTGQIGGTLSLFDGKNSVTNSGRIGSGVNFGSGDDMLTNTGSMDASVAMGEGSNKATNSGSIGVAFSSGAGADSLTNSGTIGSVVLGDGANKLINSGGINGACTGGTGDDVFGNTGVIGGLVDLGAGTNKLTNSGSITGQMHTGSGNDTITNSGTLAQGLTTGGGDDVVKNTGWIFGNINLGDGNNTMTGGNHNELFIDDGAGNDVCKLGGGDDGIFFYGAVLAADYYDGGAGDDDLTAIGAGIGFVFNLDSKAVSLAGETVAANTIQSFGDTVYATIKGFETCVGTNLVDIVIGGAAAETLAGVNGADVIMGGGGADSLRGGNDSDAFIYRQVSDSGPTRTTRDTIVDFQGAGILGGDVIDLSGIDADTKLANDQAFSLVADQFSHTPGELRIVTVGADSIIQGDVNGDGKVDFSIAVLGTTGLTADDLSL